MTSNITSSSESIVPNPHLTPTSPPPITFPRSGTANTRYILYRAPVPSTSKRSYRLTVITKDSAQLYITFEGRVSYRGRRAQPPVDTIEWWEIVALLPAVQFWSFSLILFLLVVVVVVQPISSGSTKQSCCTSLTPNDIWLACTVHPSRRSLSYGHDIASLFFLVLSLCSSPWLALHRELCRLIKIPQHHTENNMARPRDFK